MKKELVLHYTSLWLEFEKAGEMKCKKMTTVSIRGVGTDPTPEFLTRSDGGTEKGGCGDRPRRFWGTGFVGTGPKKEVKNKQGGLRAALFGIGVCLKCEAQRLTKFTA